MASYAIISQRELAYNLNGEHVIGTEVVADFTADTGTVEQQTYWWATTDETELNEKLQEVASHISAGYSTE